MNVWARHCQADNPLNVMGTLKHPYKIKLLTPNIKIPYTCRALWMLKLSWERVNINCDALRVSNREGEGE